MKKLKNIAILTGGTSSERDIALTSSKTISRLLNDHYSVTSFVFPDDIEAFISQRQKFDCVAPVFHGRGGEDGTIQGFLETLGLPYLFSGVAAQAIGIDKDLAKRIASSVGIQTPAWRMLSNSGANVSLVQSFPCIVKPVDGGSTQGVTIVKSAEDLEPAFEVALRSSKQVLVEDMVVGDEFTVAVVDERSEAVAMPVIQIKSMTGIYDFAAKYGSQPADKICPALIPNELSLRLQTAAVLMHKTIGARQLSRSDFMVDRAGVIWFLEINTIPGLSVLFPRAVAASGRDFSALLCSWIEDATKVARYTVARPS